MSRATGWTARLRAGRTFAPGRATLKGLAFSFAAPESVPTIAGSTTLDAAVWGE
jgi:hypothetical protein